MPKFLEDRLKRSAAHKGLRGKRADKYVFGTMNKLGAVRGNKITEKGREMERKHKRDKRSSRRSSRRGR